LAKSKITILGAGISGLFTAIYLADNAPNKCSEIVVLEKESAPGGLFSSTNYNGYTWDNGIFIFFDDSPLVQLFKDEFSLVEDHKQLAWNGKNIEEYPLPIKMILSRLPLYKIGSIFCDYAYSRIRLGLKLTRPNFHDWLRYRLTGIILENSMLENYIVKLQGRKPMQLSERLGIERFSDIDNSTKPFNLFMRYFRDLTKRKTLKAANPMYYFSHGAGSFASKLAALCIAKGIKINFNAKVENICSNPQDELDILYSCTERQNTLSSDFIIATNPIDNIGDICISLLNRENFGGYKSLYFKKMLLLFYIIDKSCILNRHLLLYSLDPNQPWKRLKAQSLPNDKTSLIVEATLDELPTGNPGSLIQTVTDSLTNELKLFRPEDILATDTNFIHEAYPIYDLGHEIITQNISERLEKHNIFLCGRQGAFRYFSSDKAIQSGILAAKALINKINQS
jgi:protoporphyrinogen oxidase